MEAPTRRLRRAAAVALGAAAGLAAALLLLTSLSSAHLAHEARSKETYAVEPMAATPPTDRAALDASFALRMSEIDADLAFELVTGMPCMHMTRFEGCAQFPSQKQSREALGAAVYAGSGFAAQECHLLCYTYVEHGEKIRKATANNETQGFEYFGMMGEDCYCAHTLRALGLPSDEVDRGLPKPPAAEDPWCGEPCGDTDLLSDAHYCGSDALLAAYSTGYPHAVPGDNGTVVEVTNVNDLPCLKLEKYVGCFRHAIGGGCRHNGNSSVLQVEPFGRRARHFSTTQCRNLCFAGNYTFFGVGTASQRCFCGTRLEPNDAVLKPPSSCGSFGGAVDAYAVEDTPYIYGACAKQGYLPPQYTCGPVPEQERQLDNRYMGISCWMPVYCTGLDWHDCSTAGIYA